MFFLTLALFRFFLLLWPSEEFSDESEFSEVDVVPELLLSEFESSEEFEDELSSDDDLLFLPALDVLNDPGFVLDINFSSDVPPFSSRIIFEWLFCSLVELDLRRFIFSDLGDFERSRIFSEFLVTESVALFKLLSI